MFGQPQTVAALTTASADDALAVLYVEADKANVGEIMRRMLATFRDPAVLVFHPATRLILGTTEAAVTDDVLDMWQAASGPETILTPATAGVLTKWNAAQDDLNLAWLLANTLQSRSFYGLVNTGLGVWGNQSPPQAEPCVLVNQVAGEVRFKFCDLAALSSLAVSGQTVAVRFAAPKIKLAFE